MIITISGSIGSGKSTAGKLLAKKLKYRFYSIGDIKRKMAKDMGLSIRQLIELEKKDPSRDIKVDKYQAKLAKREKNLVIDSRLGYYFIPNSIKIFLDADLDERADRIFKLSRKAEQYRSKKDAKKKILERQRADIKRYKKLYKTNPYDLAHYDLIIDTTNAKLGQTVDKILSYLKKTE